MEGFGFVGLIDRFEVDVEDDDIVFGEWPGPPTAPGVNKRP